MTRQTLSLTCLCLGMFVSLASAAPPKEGKPAPKPEAKPGMTCELITKEAPRGGLLEVEGEGFGTTPLVRIAGKVTRIVERHGNRISVQIPRDSDGGSVTVHASKAKKIECGALRIIGKNGKND